MLERERKARQLGGAAVDRTQADKLGDVAMWSRPFGSTCIADAAMAARAARNPTAKRCRVIPPVLLPSGRNTVPRGRFVPKQSAVASNVATGGRVDQLSTEWFEVLKRRREWDAGVPRWLMDTGRSYG